MPKWYVIVFCSLVLFLMPSIGHAEQILYDDFSNTNYVDTNKTSAYWDQPNTLYRLPLLKTPQAIQVAEYGTEYAVATGTGINFYQWNNGTSSMNNNASLAISYTNPLGLAMRKDERSLWVFDSTNVERYDYDGSSMVYNPNLSVLGLSGVLSVASQPYQDSMAVLTNDGKVSVYQIDSSSGSFIQNTALTFNTGISNPLSVSMISGSSDLVVTDASGSHYFSYVNGTGYVQSANLSKLGLTNVVGHDQHDGTLTIMEDGQVNRYLYDGNTMQYSSVLSANNTDIPIALSTRSDNYDFAYISSNGDGIGNVEYYNFDGTQMVKNTSLGVTGLSLLKSYVSPKSYQSIQVSASKPCDLVRITTDEQNDANTSISYSVSPDGGVTFYPVTVGIWNQLPVTSSSFTVRADLQTTNPYNTPRLLDIKVEATKVKLSNLTVTNMLYPPPGQAVPTSTFPFYVRAGAEFTFTVDTDGYVDTLIARLTNGDTVTMTPKNPISDEANTWLGRYAPSVTETTGTSVGVNITANFQSWSSGLTQNPFYITNGSVSQATGIKLVQ